MNILSLKHAMRLVSIAVLVIVNVIVLSGQSNPSFLDYNIKKGEAYTFQINSTSDPIARVDLDIPDWGYINVSDAVSPGVYEITYHAPDGYVGEIEFLIEYTGVSGFPLSTFTKYTKVSF